MRNEPGLAEIRAEWITYAGSLERTIRQFRVLLHTIARLREQRDALYTAAEVVAEGDLTWRDAYEEEHCFWCAGEEDKDTNQIKHTPECFVMTVRTLLSQLDAEEEEETE